MDGNKLNKISMQTEDRDEDDIFMDSLSQGIKIAKSALVFENDKRIESNTKLISAANSLYPVSIYTILK